MENPMDIGQFIGRFHVVLLHLPIGFLVAVGCLELLALHPKHRHVVAPNRVLLLLTAPVAVLTAICGWLLAQEGGYDQKLLSLHRWTGVAVAGLACILLLLHLRGWMSLYRAGLVIAIGVTVVSGHFGGSLTHGRGYLIRHGPDWLAPGMDSAHDSDDDDPGFFAVDAVFSKYCVSCHGPDKSKAGLRLDSYDHVLAGSDSGPVIVPGDTADSLLLHRLHLPMEDDDHMPPEGKPQPGPGDIDVIQRWILEDAPE